jgi:outer membrane murein-binding lipoprotein Lpp
MTIGTMQIRSIYLLAALAIASVGLQGCAQQIDAATKAALETAQAQAQLARDVQQIQNLMSRRAFYHSAGRNDLEFELYAKSVPDISWGQNQGFQVGAETIKKFYVDENIANRKAELARMSKLYPQLKNDDANMGAGSFVIHSLTTPIIEVAGDGKTAKGVWYTPGALAMTDAKGKFFGNWLWERYAVDFIKEDGQWRFWHILVLTDFMSGMGKDIQAMAEAPVGSEAAKQQAAEAAKRWTVVTTNYKSWGPTTAQQVAPRLPEPYQTFADTFSYGAPAK